MGKTVTVEVLGVDKIIKDCKTIAQTRRMKQAINRATGIVNTTAKQLCPKVTGALVNSIHMTTQDTGNDYVGKVYTNKEYAPYVEFGTGRKGAMSNYPNGGQLGLAYGSKAGQTAKPFMYPALKWNEQKISKMIEDAIRNEI